VIVLTQGIVQFGTLGACVPVVTMADLIMAGDQSG